MLLPSLLSGITAVLLAFAAVIHRHNAHMPPRSDSLAAWSASASRGASFVQLSATHQPRHRPARTEPSGPQHYRSKDAPIPSWKGTVRKTGRHAFPELATTHRAATPPRPYPSPYPYNAPTVDLGIITPDKEQS